MVAEHSKRWVCMVAASLPTMIEAENGSEGTEELSPLFIEPDTHSFVIKIWLEETADETTHPVWRGYITHVATGQRRYLDNLSAMARFIAPYLTRWNIKLSLRERFCLWLKQKK